jgi:CubicO group peptidase (beta-lactamase class C family)
LPAVGVTAFLFSQWYLPPFGLAILLAATSVFAIAGRQTLRGVAVELPTRANLQVFGLLCYAVGTWQPVCCEEVSRPILNGESLRSKPDVRINALSIAIGIAMLPPLALAQNSCGLPDATTDQWSVAAPESVGLASAPLCSMVKWLDGSKESNVHAVLVVRHGILVFEHYFSGSDEAWGRPIGNIAFGREVRHDERSATKSVISLLLGIAIDHGLVKGIDEPVLSFFPEYADLRTPEKDRITLRHLITMSAGLEWHELDIPYTNATNSYARMEAASDPYRFVLEQPLVAPPGDLWNYNSGATEVIAAVLKKATGNPVDDFARKLLFEPLGITDVEWPRDAHGNVIAGGALRLRPRDLAKIGQLVLQHGNWRDTQVVPASWIDAATTPQIGIGSDFYGYFFWLGRSLVDRHEIQYAAAVGLGGQRVFVVPEFDLVMVMNAGLYQSPVQGLVAIRALDQYVLEAASRRSP